MPDGREEASTAAAPGKLLWLGEYAVLGGAAAIVCSVDRQVRATLWPSAGRRSRVTATNLPGAPLEFEHSGRRIAWISRPAGLELAARVIDLAIGEGLAGKLPPFEAQIDSGALYSGPHKIGIGSSAAVAVALYRALLRLAARRAPAPEDAFALLDALHRDFQSGRGSGVDVAAAVFGGLLEFRRGTEGLPARIEPLPLPADLHWCAVFCGRSASTAGYLARLEEARAADPPRIDRLLSVLGELARRACTALRAGDAAAFVSHVDPYAALLRELGDAAGIDIVSAEHRELRRLAAAHGVAYKSSGAGGGDIGIGFCTDASALAAFRTQAGRAGFVPLDLGVAPAVRWTDGEQAARPRVRG